MGLEFDLVKLDGPNSATTQNVTISGFGTPDAVFCFANSATSTDSTPNDDAWMILGVWDGTNQRSIASFSDDNQATSQTSRGQSNGRILIEPNAAGSSLTNIARITATVTDGITVTWDAAKDWTVTYVFIRGVSAVTVGSKQLSTSSTTNDVSLSHEPHLVFLLGGGGSTETSAFTNGLISFGLGHYDGTNTDQWSIQFFDDDNVTTTDSGSYFSTVGATNEYIGGQVTDTAHSYKLTFSRPSSNTLRLTSSTTSTGGDWMFYLAIALTDASEVAIGSSDWTMSTSGTDNAVTGVGFEPDFIFSVVSNQNTSNKDIYLSAPTLRFGMGASNNTTEYCIHYWSQGNAATSDCSSHFNAALSSIIGTGPVYSGPYTVQSFDADGFTIRGTRTSGTSSVAWPHNWLAVKKQVSSTDDLTPTDVESASEVDSPALEQAHALTANDAESASAVSAPTLSEQSGAHNLSPTDVEALSNVDMPAITQTHALTATDVQSASSVDTPALSSGGTTSGTIKQDLISYWALSESTGGRADSYGYGDLDEQGSIGNRSGALGDYADIPGTSGNYLSRSDGLFSNAGDADWEGSVRVILDAKTARYGIVSCDDGAGLRDWRLDYDQATDRFRFLIFFTDNTFTSVSATSFGSPSTATEYLIHFGHDAANDQIFIAVNNGTVDTTSYTGKTPEEGDANNFYVGTYAGAGQEFNGAIGELYLWRRILTTDERTEIYNGGSGRTFAQLVTINDTAALHYAEEVDVIANTANQFSYEATITFNKTGPHAFGVVARQADDGKGLTVKIDGTSELTVTLRDDALASLAGLEFEDGGIINITSTGSKTVRFEADSNAWLIRGVIIREPDSESGIVEDQGSATHCTPHASVYNGSTYQVHVEMYSGECHLSKDGLAQGKIFDAITADRNERYHNGAAVVAMSAGVAVIQVGHNRPQIRVRYLPGGAIGSITSVYTAGGAASKYTYVRAGVLDNGDLIVLTRGDDTGAGDKHLVLFTISDVPQIDGTGASFVRDVVARDQDTHGGSWCYPRQLEVFNDGSQDVVVCTFAYRDDTTVDWQAMCAVLYAPGNGTEGNWYSLDGDINNRTTRGTDAVGRFTSTQLDTQTKDGDGVLLLGKYVADEQRYCISVLGKVTTWPVSGSAPKGAVLLAFADTDQNERTYANVTLRWCIQNEGTRSVSPADFDSAPNIFEWNSYRFTAAANWQNDDPSTDTAYMVISNRGKRLPGQVNGDVARLYYSWGSSNTFEVIKIDNPMTAASISWTSQESISIEKTKTAGFITRVWGDPGEFVYQTNENQLHEVHAQSFRESISATVTHALTPTDVSSISQVSAPVLGGPGTDELTPTDVESTSQVSTPALNSENALAAVDVQAQSQVSAPTLVDLGSITNGQLYVLLMEIHKILGLDADAPMTVTASRRTAGNISQSISGDGVTSTTVTRDP